MNSYEKRFQADGTYKIWEAKNKRFVDEQQIEYQAFVKAGGVATVVQYVAPAVYVPTLEESKESKMHDISRSYEEYDRTASVNTTLGYPIQVGQDHITKLHGAIQFAEMVNATNIYITDSNNITHENVTLANAKKALIEVMTAAMTAHKYKQELRAKVNAAATTEAVTAIVWNLN